MKRCVMMCPYLTPESSVWMWKTLPLWRTLLLYPSRGDGNFVDMREGRRVRTRRPSPYHTLLELLLPLGRLCHPRPDLDLEALAVPRDGHQLELHVAPRRIRLPADRPRPALP